MSRLALCLALLPAMASADAVVTDGFGIAPAGQAAPERATWTDAPTGGGPKAPGPVGTVLFFVGPKALVAGRDRAHLVALALDADGNLAADGQPAQFAMAPLPGGQGVTRDGIADLLVMPPPRSGRMIGGVTIGGRQSPPGDLTVTADLSDMAPHLLAPQDPVAAGDVVMLSTQPLIDRHGNAAPDGIALGLTVQGPDGAGMLTATTLGGQGRTVLLPRDLGGDLAAGIALGGNAGDGTTIMLRPDQPLAAPPLSAWADADLGLTRLRLGPVTTTAGHLMPDGTPVTLTAADDRTAQAWLIDGHADLTLTHLTAPGEIQVDLTLPGLTESRRVILGPPPRAVIEATE